MKPKPKIELPDINHENTFMRFDIAISYDRHLLNKVNNVYPSLMEAAKSGLSVRVEDVVEIEDLTTLCKDAGGIYGWDRRREFHDPKSRALLEQHLADKSTARRFTFLANGKVVGGAIIANVEKAVNEDGKPRLTGVFGRAESRFAELGFRERDAKKVIEIFKIGLLPEATGQGWGRYFVSEVLNYLFEQQEEGGARKYDAVYLNTRSTNHGGVLNFYRRLNMFVIDMMTLKDDVLTDEEIAEYAIKRAEMARDLINDFAALNGFKDRGPTFDREATGMAPAI